MLSTTIGKMVGAKLSICKHRWSDARIQKPFYDQQNPLVARLESMTLLDMFADPLDSRLDKCRLATYQMECFFEAMDLHTTLDLNSNQMDTSHSRIISNKQ